MWWELISTDPRAILNLDPNLTFLTFGNDIKKNSRSNGIFDRIFGNQRYLPIKKVNGMTPVPISCAELSLVQSFYSYFVNNLR